MISFVPVEHSAGRPVSVPYMCQEFRLELNTHLNLNTLRWQFLPLRVCSALATVVRPAARRAGGSGEGAEGKTPGHLHSVDRGHF